MRRIPVTSRLSATHPGRILLDTSKLRRSWVGIENKKYRKQIARTLTSYAKETKTVWSYTVIDCDSPPISGFRSASYLSGSSKDTLLTTSFNDFIREISEKMDRLTSNSMANIEPIRDEFKLSERPLREIAEVQFGRGRYRWTPYIKSLATLA